MTNDESTNWEKYRKWIIVGILAGVTITVGKFLGVPLLSFGIKYYSGLVPVSSLPVEELPELDGQMAKICNPQQLSPPLSLDFPFPVLSPNSQFYADLAYLEGSRKVAELRLYDAENDQLLGSYSYKELYVYCWADDSSGVYVADSIPGTPDFPIPGKPSWKGVVKKVLVR